MSCFGYTKRAKLTIYFFLLFTSFFCFSPVETKTKIESIKKLFVETMLEQDGSMYGGSASVTMPWVDALKHGSSEVGAFLSTLLCQDRIENGSGKENGANEIEACLANGNKQAASESSNVKVAPKGTSLRSRVAAAGSILSAVSYCCERASESDITAPDHSRPLRDIILASHLEKIEGSSISPEGSGKVDQSMLKLKGLAAKELKESIDLLSKELQANSVAKGINSEVSTN